MQAASIKKGVYTHPAAEPTNRDKVIFHLSLLKTLEHIAKSQNYKADNHQPK